MEFLLKGRDFDRGIEVGVRHGDGSRKILRHSNIKKLYGLDIRVDYNAKAIEFEFPNRYTYIVGKSPDYAANFPDEYFDLIYIDADHTYGGCLTDLINWYPKLKKGGLFFGDDYIVCNNPTEGYYGVVGAVEEFAQSKQLDVKIEEYNFNKEERLEYAQRIGKLVEDNLWIIHAYLFPAEAILGRKRTEGINIPYWWIIKE